MYYSVRSGTGKGSLATAVSANTPFQAAVKALQQHHPSELGVLIEITGDDETHYVSTVKVLESIGAVVDDCDA
jgi:hypothetical protein